jgi:hypothetical protein
MPYPKPANNAKKKKRFGITKILIERLRELKKYAADHYTARSIFLQAVNSGAEKEAL